jgi:four helix bundle protein
MKVQDFRGLEVYKAAFELQQQIFQLTKSFPAEERYALTGQIRRSSRSIGANLSEAWKKRQYPAHFASKLTDADGEQSETIHWLDTCFSCGYIDQDLHQELVHRCEQIGRMLGAMIKDAEQWCVGSRSSRG